MHRPSNVNIYLHVLDSHRAGQISRPDVTRVGSIVVLTFGPVSLFLRHTKHLEPGKYV